MDIPLAERSFYFVALIFAHQAVVNKHTGELAADSLRHKRCSDRGIYAAGQR